ncbi:hypothetical protein ACIF9R_15965 [Streptomyces sp. NPDC086080]|uniref:AMP-binding enzyme n=1 Tax=Streptomyces sp. NPDC086080 TaxID=3365748 RepID=UPI0037D16556
MRYIRSPGAPKGQATNRSDVRPGLPTYPRATCTPATYSSPTTLGGAVHPLPVRVDRGLRTVPGVVDAVAVTEEAAGGESVLVVYTTLDGETATARTATVLRDACAERLPAHMVPNRITVVSEMPLAPSGKLDRARLSTDTELRVTLR